MKNRKVLGAIISLLVFVAVFGMRQGSTEVWAAEKTQGEPIVQVFKIKGEVTVKRNATGEESEVKKGYLLTSEDLLTLEKDALVGLYFKQGGKKEIKAEQTTLTQKIGDLLLKKEIYAKTVPTFGGTRGIYPSELEAEMDIQSFFYPQETMILDSLPSIELTIFNGTDVPLHIPRATVRILEDERVVQSKDFRDLESGTAYRYPIEDLAGGTEYTLEIQPDISEFDDMGLAFTSNFYVADPAGQGAVSGDTSFGDSLYKSIEYTALEQETREYGLWFVKHLQSKGEGIKPVIAVDLFIK